jgi:hypothetical protein
MGEMLMKRAIFMMMGFILVFASCSSGIRFVVCPNEIAEKMKMESDVGERKELLFGLNYRVIVVHKTPSNKIVPVQHFRPEHTFGYRTHPKTVSFENPLMLGTLIIIGKLQKPLGIAIKDNGDINWRIYWLKDADIKELRNNGVVYLPPYNRLSLIINGR